MEKQKLLQNLTGVGSSKLSYYMELKEKTRELEERNAQLEILNEIAKSVKLNTSLEYSLKRIAFLLNKVIPVYSLGIYKKNKIKLFTVVKCYRNNVVDDFVKVDSKDIDMEDELNGAYRPMSIIKNGFTVFPLKTKMDDLGFMLVKLENNINLNRQQVEFLLNITDHLSIGLENSSLYEEVLNLNKRWEETFKAITDNIYVIDSDYNIIRYNRAAQVNYFLDDSSGSKKCYKVLHGRDKPCSDCIMNKLLKNKEPVQNREKRGEYYLDIYAYPTIDTHGEVSGAVLYERDVTDKLMMESQLIHSAKLKSTGEMAAGIAHELNNPLTTVLGNSQLLIAEFGEEDERKMLANKILESGKRCKNIIQKLLSFAREEELTWEKVSLNDCVSDVLDMINYQLEKKGVNIDVRKKEDLPPVLGNKQQLEQVVLNFIFNARDALETVEKPKMKIETGYEEKTERVFVSVMDNGAGISKKERGKLFQPFYSTKEKSKGYGLGLFVSLGISENHKGEIKVESEEDEGSRFTLFIPL